MRNRFHFLFPILDYLGALFWIFGFVLFVPLVAQIYYTHATDEATSIYTFGLPALIAFVLGFALKRRVSFERIDGRGAMMLCVFAWVGISAVGALPFRLALPKVTYLDAFFEAISGFTTTGITMLHGLDDMPLSVLLWRSMIQWLGGLGILTFFLAIISTRGSTHVLFSAETHKIFARRPVPNLFRTLRILWAIYVAFTALSVVLLIIEGMSPYDAVCHSMTAISTGGYSHYDASIAHYQQAGTYAHYAAIEYTLVLVMLLGGINFFIHYRLLTGDIRALWDNLEIRLWWGLLVGAVILVAGSRFLKVGFTEAADTIRCAVFQVVAIATTTGFGTKDIGDPYFTPLAKQVFLVLMVVGGCVGSTGGGIKVMRIGVLLKMVGRQVRQVVCGRSTLNPIVVDGEVVESEEIRRISALFFAWIALLVIGGAITAVLSSLGPMESASGMFSALGNIGPCYIPAHVPADSGVDAMTNLHPGIKITYIVGMLAGRLEILPILLLFSRRAWR